MWLVRQSWSWTSKNELKCAQLISDLVKVSIVGFFFHVLPLLTCNVEDPGCFLREPGSNFFHPGSQIQFFPSQIQGWQDLIADHGSASKNLSIFNPKKLSSQNNIRDVHSGSRILDLDFFSSKIPIPNSGSRGQIALDLRSRIQIRNTAYMYSIIWCPKGYRITV